MRAAGCPTCWRLAGGPERDRGLQGSRRYRRQLGIISSRRPLALPGSSKRGNSAIIIHSSRGGSSSRGGRRPLRRPVTLRPRFTGYERSF